MEELMTTDACTLPRAERPLRLAELDTLFAGSVRRVDRGKESVRLHLSGAAGLRETVRDLADRESSCCSFLTFSLQGQHDDLTLHITAPAERRDLLDALADRAEELSA
jgi:hypothetical protein